jgi:replication-associated recombination protein RarA
LHRLHERHSQEALLKLAEDFPGLLIAAVMADRYRELIPPLRERFETVWLEPPTEDEVVAFLAEKCSGEWRILAEEAILRAMVQRSGVSFRICLKILAAAAEREPRRLDLPLLDDLLGRSPGSGDSGPSPEDGTSVEDEEGDLFPD